MVSENACNSSVPQRALAVGSRIEVSSNSLTSTELDALGRQRDLYAAFFLPAVVLHLWPKATSFTARVSGEGGRWVDVIGLPSAESSNGWRWAREPYVAPTVRELSPAEAERMLEQRAPGLIAGARAGRAAVEAMQAQCAFCARCSREQGEGGANLIVDPTEPRGSRLHCSFGTGCWLESRCWNGGGPFEGPRLHQVISDFFYTEAGEADEERAAGGRFPNLMGLLRETIADALRARLGSSPALEDFVLATDAAVSR
jgi:hypothetical protein